MGHSSSNHAFLEMTIILQMFLLAQQQAFNEMKHGWTLFVVSAILSMMECMSSGFEIVVLMDMLPTK